MLLSHLLKYDWLLVNYLMGAGMTIQAKQEEIWECTWTVANAIGMSPQAHLGLALDMLEHLPTTPTGLAFTSGVPLLMVHSPEALAYQGEGMGSNDFQLLTVPVTAAVPLSPDTSCPAKTSAPPPNLQTQQPHPARRLCTGSDFIKQPDTED